MRSGGEVPRVVDGQLDATCSSSPSVHAGRSRPSSAVGMSSPSPASRPELERRHHAREVVGAGLRGSRPLTSRDRVRSGRWSSSRVISATDSSLSPPASPAGGSPVTWACAHAQLSSRSGSSVDGSAGAAIVSTGSDPRRGGSSRTPGCLRTTARHSHGRSCCCGVGRRRREQPRQARLVELDQREVVRLERPRSRASGRCGSPAPVCRPVTWPGPISRTPIGDRRGAVDGERGERRSATPGWVGGQRVRRAGRPTRRPRRTHGSRIRSESASTASRSHPPPALGTSTTLGAERGRGVQQLAGLGPRHRRRPASAGRRGLGDGPSRRAAAPARRGGRRREPGRGLLADRRQRGGAEARRGPARAARRAGRGPARRWRCRRARS